MGDAQDMLDRSSDGVDMNGQVREVSRTTVFTGPIFSIDDIVLELPTTDGSTARIRRQLIRHAPCVVMLVHDVPGDRYLIEREYRVGSDRFAYGLPAGLMDPGENPEQAALRELAEETGTVPDTADAARFDHAGAYYSSEGMTDELAHIMVIHLDRWHTEERHFDADEHVESAWVPWRQLQDTPVTESNAIIAIQHEMLRRTCLGGTIG
ncbi:NUDIX hydrolase [Bifidobacterium thermophilum]|uniref:NUDIX hydrolase n=1 Tax=Bifidobacterium thermophilum TaxID=33905 RepID=UPI0030A76BD4